MFWSDRIAKEIIKSSKYHPFHVDDMKTPSGRVHVGSLRGVVIHDLIYKSLQSQGKEAIYTYCINDMDPMDGFPPYLDRDKFYKYMGCPLYRIPSPFGKDKTFSQYFADEFIEVFKSIDCNPEVIWTSELYQKGKFDEIVKTVLDNTGEIRKIFKQHYEDFDSNDYYPYQPICPKCGKIATTKISKWDGEFVHFSCFEDAVGYTKGCGFSGKLKPDKDSGKMPWKIEWAAHWKLLGVTVEWAGKDHMTEGGSYYLSAKICSQILKYPPPHAKLYEYLLVGGRKMSSSKGKGASAKEVSEILPPNILRFLQVRTHYRKTIDFNPEGSTIPDLFDEYDKLAKIYYAKGEKDDFGRIWQFSQIEKIPEKRPFFPRFRDVANYVQNPKVDITKQFERIKGKVLTKEEKKILKRRIKYARIWLKTYAPKEVIYKITETIPQIAVDLSKEQKLYLFNLAEFLERNKEITAESLQQEIYDKAKGMNLPMKKAFQAIYLSLIGKTHGPKAAWFIINKDINQVITRFKDIRDHSFHVEKIEHDRKFPDLTRKDVFTIDPEFAVRYPSTIVGIAIIKNVSISKEDNNLQEEIDKVVRSMRGLTTKEIGEYPQIQSYRKIYKETGVDWHSKRPSPEALLRRVALGKQLPKINTCVDAYNLIVLKNHISAGAFDLDEMELPARLRFARKGDEIILLGDTKPTKYTSGEVAYFDQIGGYNIHFNHLDAERTKVTNKTKNLFINVEGVYDISLSEVEKTLDEVIKIISHYCGGEVELVGILTGKDTKQNIL